MSVDKFDIWCTPKTHVPLQQKQAFLVSQDGTSFPISTDNIPVFLKPNEIVGLNQKYQHFYDKIARGYDWAWFFYKYIHKGAVKERATIFKDLVIKQGMDVLETSIGTGLNIPLFTKDARYFGIDISMGMLQVCQRENKKWGYDLQIAQANAEELPFKDNFFDVVFHVGGINFFNDIPEAISEMIRVAKPGAQILICDETQEHIDKSYKRLPFVKRFFKDTHPVIVPMQFIPHGVSDLKLDYAFNNRMYVITFRKA